MRKKNGFTIIEMLVTIAIISIISAVAVFSITTYINNTKETSDKLTIKSIKDAAELYIKEFPDNIKWTDDNKIQYICLSIKELKNSGLINEQIKIYDNKMNITDNTLIKVTKDKTTFTIIKTEFNNNDCQEND